MSSDSMYSQNPASNADGFQLDFNRIIRIVSSLAKDPKNAWGELQTEYGTTKSLYLNFILPLLTFAALCSFIKLSVIGISIPYIGVQRMAMTAGITNLVVQVLSQAAIFYVAAMVLTKLAPTFGGNTNELQVLRLLAFSGSIGWVASAAIIIPMIGWLIAFVAGIYGIYVFYQGVTAMTGVPETDRLKFTVIGALCVFVVAFVLMAVVHFIVPSPTPYSMPTA